MYGYFLHNKEQTFFIVVAKMNDRTILHVDMNNFYASVEVLYQPKLANIPLAVAGDPANRHGIILAKNQLAKKAGVKTAEAIWEAKQKCPNLVCVPPNYDRYILYSKLAQELYKQYTPLVEAFGLDECWLDVTGCQDSGATIAEEIRQRIKDELRLTVSVGHSFNKIFAKLGSDYKKPDAVTTISRENFKELVWPLPVSDLLMVGRSTAAKLNRINVRTIGSLAALKADYIESILHKPGLLLWQFANGLDESPVRAIVYGYPIKSVGNGLTTPADLTTWEEIKQTVYPLAEKVAARLRAHQFLTTTVQVGIRTSTLWGFERQRGLSYPLNTAKGISDLALTIISENLTTPYQIRALTIRATQLISSKDQRQISFLPYYKEQEQQDKLESTIDTLRLRFGDDIIKRGIMLKSYLNKESFMLPEQRVHPVSFFWQ